MHIYTYFSFELDDPEFKNFSTIFEELLESFGRGFAADFFPILRHFPSSKANGVRRIMNKFYAYVETQVNEHRKTFHEGNPNEKNICFIQPY